MRRSVLRVERHLVVDREGNDLALDRARDSLRRHHSIRARNRRVHRSFYRFRRSVPVPARDYHTATRVALLSIRSSSAGDYRYSTAD